MEKPWLAHYPPGVPAEINADAYPSIIAVFEESCRNFAKLPAFSNMNTQISYQQLDSLTRDFAAFLQNRLFLQHGDRVAIMLPNLLQYPVVMLGSLRAGAVVVNVNPLYTPRELAHQLADSGAKIIVVLANFAHVLQAALPETPIEHIIITEIGDLFPFLKRKLVNYVVKKVKRLVPTWSISHTINFTDALATGKQMPFTMVPLRGEDIAFLQYTGGTTGIAKGAILTHRNMVANIMQAYAWLKPIVEFGKEIIITALPLYHIFSLLANCLTFIRLGALNILITNPRDIPGFIKELKGVPFTTITGVNTLFNALLNNPDFAQLNFKKVHLALGGGMAVQEAVAKRWQEVTGKPLLEAYGLTETSPAACINPLNLSGYNGSVGLPLPSTDVMIRDRYGKPVLAHKPGELCIKGPQVTQGYWNMPAETHKIFTEDGWLLTGDIATLDEKGFVYIVDRKKDMINISGFNVYPNEIEAIIAGHPDVLEVAVVGVPHEVTGEQVKAFVVRKNPQLDEAALLSFCRQHLTGYKIPKVVEFRDQLPKSNVGKILRRSLREEEEQKTVLTNAH